VTETPTSDDVTPGELGRWLTRVERKLDLVTDDHERRIRRLELIIYVSTGVVVAGGGGAALMQAFGGGG